MKTKNHLLSLALIAVCGLAFLLPYMLSGSRGVEIERPDLLKTNTDSPSATSAPTSTATISPTFTPSPTLLSSSTPTEAPTPVSQTRGEPKRQPDPPDNLVLTHQRQMDGRPTRPTDSGGSGTACLFRRDPGVGLIECLFRGQPEAGHVTSRPGVLR